MTECPKNNQGSGNGVNRAQSSLVASPDREAPRRATSSDGGGVNRFYALNNRHKHENSPYVVTGMIQVFDFTVYALLDLGANLSFVTPYVVMNFEIISLQLNQPLSVYNPIRESILA